MSKSILLTLFSILWLSAANTDAKILVDGPGCYKVKGILMDSSATTITLGVLNETRSQHAIKIKTPTTAQLTPGLKIQAIIFKNQNGFTSANKAIRPLSPNSDIYSGAWQKISNNECER